MDATAARLKAMGRPGGQRLKKPGSKMSRRSGHDLLTEARLASLQDRYKAAYQRRIEAWKAKDSAAFTEADVLVTVLERRLQEALPPMKKCKTCGMKGKPGGKCANGHKIPGGDY